MAERISQRLHTSSERPSSTEIWQPTLWEFVRAAWHVLEPAHPFVDNWHIGAICELLEAVTLRQIQNLLINIPPRHLKSLLVSVFWPCWEWGPMQRPDLRYINSSYASNLSIRDNVKSRTLIQSGWFQSQWGSVFRLRDDQNVKVKFENYQGGFRLASYVGGGTGEGGDRLICDDPNNVTDVESDTIRNTCNEWWDLQMYNRITNVKTAARVMIMQRTHQADLSGHVLETGGWTLLKLPTRFEPSKRCTVVYADGTKTWSDPRKKDGELLRGKFDWCSPVRVGFPFYRNTSRRSVSTTSARFSGSRVKPIPSWNSSRLLIAYAAFFFNVVVSIFSCRFNASRSLGRCR